MGKGHHVQDNKFHVFFTNISQVFDQSYVPINISTKQRNTNNNESCLSAYFDHSLLAGYNPRLPYPLFSHLKLHMILKSLYLWGYRDLVCFIQVSHLMTQISGNINDMAKTVQKIGEDRTKMLLPKQVSFPYPMLLSTIMTPFTTGAWLQ